VRCLLALSANRLGDFIWFDVINLVEN